MEKREIRINKFLSAAGVCSRREADRQIAAGNVEIDEKTAVTGDKVSGSQTVYFCGNAVEREAEEILLAVNKPVGVVCTAQKRDKDNIVDFLNYPKRIYPVGRLDKNSSGLILMTNQGEIVNKIMRAGNMHEKEYLVTVDKKLSPAFLKGMAGGVLLRELETVTRPCKVEKTGSRTFRIVLTQGLNRQIRRMCEYFNYHVEKLVRIRIMNIELGNLPPGTYRKLTPAEWQELERRIRYSMNETDIFEKRKSNLSGGQNGKGAGKGADK